MKKLVGICCLLLLVWACSSDNGGGSDDVDPGPGEVSFARAPMLENWADNIIVPAYAAFSAEITNLRTAFETFKVTPDESNLIALRLTWLEAYKTWQRASPFETGPAEIVGLRLNLNTYPADVNKIEAHVLNGGYDLSLSSNRDAKGFSALDYLINGLGATDSDIVSKFNDPIGNTNYLSYFEDVLSDMEQLSNGVLSEWENGFRDTFVANDGSSSTASVDRLVNDFIFYYEKFLRAGKMGIPLGVFSGSVEPTRVEAFYKGDISKSLFLEGLSGVQDFFNGDHFNGTGTGESLDSYLDALNTVKDGEDLKKIINDQFNTARTLVNNLDSFKSEIENNTPPTQMLLAYDEVQRAVPLLKVDMVSAMSISIDFVDADGD